MADEQAGKKSIPQFEKEALLLIDDHEEEISENGKTVRKRGIYLLPNLFTTAALFSGFFAIVSAMNGQFESAAIAIFVSMIFDGLDGRVARLMNAQSKFGAEYDSLADMVSFGVAPALVVFSWGVSALGKFGWAVAFIYVSCAALRLARFNTQIDTADKNFFTGLASPAAAAVMAGMVWVSAQEGWVTSELPIELAVLAGVLMAVIGMLMIVNVRYNSFKGIDFKGRVPFVVMILVVLAFGLISVDPARILLGIALVYALSGPVQASYRRLKKSAFGVNKNPGGRHLSKTDSRGRNDVDSQTSRYPQQRNYPESFICDGVK